MEGLRTILSEGPRLAYLSYMANRLRECHRVLKPTGSIYLHCDPTMSHYLKVVLDGIFNRQNFRNEVVWAYSGWNKRLARHIERRHDLILFYAMGKLQIFNYPFRPWKSKNEYLAKRKQKLRTDENGKEYVLSDAGNGERVRRYIDDAMAYGVPLDDVWQIDKINNSDKERIGYPTQKPLALLEPIIKASSNEGDTVMDPFCGCGTSIHAAQNLGRRWIGIDVCVNACKIIEKRLRSSFDSVWSDVKFIGMPKTQPQAKTLADMDKFRFERWAVALVDGMEANRHQRGDKGIDGWGRFPIRKGKWIDMVSQVKGGGTSPGDVQAFNGARQQAKAHLGIFTCFEDRVTSRMRDAAASTGRFLDVPRVQIYTVDDYFKGLKPRIPMAA